MTVEELERLISSITWDDFEKTDLGEFTVGYVPPGEQEPLFIKFSMRVGLHMNRPFQVVIADKQFVRLRAAPAYTGHVLKRLFAADPNYCLYTPRVRTGFNSRPLWQPEELAESVRSSTTSYQSGLMVQSINSPWGTY